MIMVLLTGKRLVPVLALCILAGCAAVSYLTGVDTYWGHTAPVTSQGRAYSLYIAGVIHERRGELDKAIDAWLEVIAFDEQAVSPRLRLIRAQLRRGDYEQALDFCQEALRHSPDMPELWIMYGELNHRLGNIETAITAFMKTIELRPDDLTGYGALIDLQESTNDLVAAIEIYEQLINRSPNSAALYYQLGITLARINDAEYARETFEKVLELEPRITRARFFLALVLFELEEFERCADELLIYLGERPDDGVALAYRAAALARMGYLREARRTLELLLATDEAGAKHNLQLAWVLLQLGENESAQQFALEAGAYLFADIIFAGTLLEDSASDRQPGNLWDDRYSLDEVEAECDLFIGAVLGMYGERAAGEQTLDMLDALTDAAAFSPSLTFLRARILLYLERYQEALEALESMRSKDIVSKYIHYYSAIAFEKLEDFHGTEYHLRAFLEINPDDPDVLNFLGYFYAEHNVHLDEAEALLTRALKQDPENPYYLDSLGWIYYRQGKAMEAAELIRRAIYGMESDDAELRDHLGDVYLLKGNVERALAEWRRAFRLDPSMPGVREKIEKYSASELEE